MASKKELLLMLETQYKVEELSRNSYDKYIAKLTDTKLVDAITIIRNQEIKHMGLVKEMISLVKGVKSIVGNGKPSSKEVVPDDLHLKLENK